MMKNNACPICNSNQFRYIYYAEECYGIVEQHGYCNRCGYTIEQAYSDVIVGFEPDVKRGYKILTWNKSTGYHYKYVNKNVRKRKRLRRKFGIKVDQKDRWLAYI